MNMNSMLENLLIVGGLGFVFIVTNAVFLGILYFTQRKVNAIAKWPSVMGTVKKSTVEHRSSGDGGANYPCRSWITLIRRADNLMRAIASRRAEMLAALVRGKWLRDIPSVHL